MRPMFVEALRMISNERTVAFISIFGVIGLFMLSDTLSGMRNPGSALAERIPTVPSQTSLYMLANQIKSKRIVSGFFTPNV